MANFVTKIVEDRQTYGGMIWSRVLLNLQKIIKSDQFKIWLDGAKFSKLLDDTIIIAVSTEFIREWVVNNYFLLIKDEVLKIDGSITKLMFTVEKNIDICVSDVDSGKSRIFSSLNPKFAFSNYFVTEFNEIAYKMSVNIAKQHPSLHGKLTYIHSNVGMGKTHLLQSIAAQLIASRSEQEVGYITAERFMHNFVHAVKANQLFELRDVIGKINTFIIDDLQFICDKESTQKEFSLILNSLLEAGNTVVVASSLPAHMLNLRDVRTKSLLVSSNAAHIKVFDYDARLSRIRYQRK